MGADGSDAACRQHRRDYRIARLALRCARARTLMQLGLFEALGREGVMFTNPPTREFPPEMLLPCENSEGLAATAVPAAAGGSAAEAAAKRL